MAKKKSAERRHYQRLTDKLVQKLSDFARVGTLEDFGGLTGELIWDDRVRGLHARFGRHRTSWVFQKEHRRHGKRGLTYKTLGTFPAMTVTNARKAALMEAGRVAAGRITPGKRTAIKVAAALDAYVEYLRTRKAGSRWPDNVLSLARVHILPEFAGWPLHELSAARAVVADWHKKIVRKSGPAAADHAAKIMRAMYRHAMRRDPTLPPGLPTAAVEFVGAERSQRALAFTDFPKWFAAWGKIEFKTRRAFQMLNLLCGARPGELARIKWVDVLPAERVFVIRDAKSRKAKHDIRVVMSSAIARALKLARDAAGESEWVFPARAGGHIAKFDGDGLPAHGMMYRRTWRTVAADVGTDELLSRFLLGHIPPGISPGYVAKMILASGQGMRSAQRAVSRRIVALLGKGL